MFILHLIVFFIFIMILICYLCSPARCPKCNKKARNAGTGTGIQMWECEHCHKYF